MIFFNLDSLIKKVKNGVFELSKAEMEYKMRKKALEKASKKEDVNDFSQVFT